MSEFYTREELDKLSRVDLRTLAVQKWGMSNRECSQKLADHIKDFILEKQEASQNGEETPAKAANKPKASKAAKPKSNGKGTTPKGRAAKPAASEPMDTSDQLKLAGDFSEIVEKLDAVGKGMDEEMSEVKQLLTDVRDIVVDMDRKQFIAFGLLTDIYRLSFEPTDLDERVAELQQEYAGN